MKKTIYYSTWLILLALCVQCAQDDMNPIFANKKRKCLPTKIIRYYESTTTTTKGRVTNIDYDNQGNITKVSESVFDTSKSKDTILSFYSLTIRDLKSRLIGIRRFNLTTNNAYILSYKYVFDYNLKGQAILIQGTIFSQSSQGNTTQTADRGFFTMEYNAEGKLINLGNYFRGDDRASYLMFLSDNLLEVKTKSVTNPNAIPAPFRTYNLDNTKFNPYYQENFADIWMFTVPSQLSITPYLVKATNDSDFFWDLFRSTNFTLTSSKLNPQNFPTDLTYNTDFGIKLFVNISYICNE
jgi:hypothetical protein